MGGGETAVTTAPRTRLARVAPPVPSVPPTPPNAPRPPDPDNLPVPRNHRQTLLWLQAELEVGVVSAHGRALVHLAPLAKTLAEVTKSLAAMSPAEEVSFVDALAARRRNLTPGKPDRPAV